MHYVLHLHFYEFLDIIHFFFFFFLENVFFTFNIFHIKLPGVTKMNS